MRVFSAVVGMIVVVGSCCLARGEDAAPFVVHPEESFNKESGVLVDVPGKKGQRGVGLRADMPRFGWCVIDLGRKFEKGRYRIALTLCATNEKAATVGLYVAGGEDHMQATYGLTCEAGKTRTVERYFFAPEGFSKLLLKKLDAAATPSVAVAEVTLTDMKQRELPRLTGYRTSFEYPAPWGLRNKDIEGMLSGTDRLGEVEAWLDRRSRAAELLGRADYLLRAHRLLRCPGSRAEMERACAAARSLEPKQLDELAKSLGAFQRELEKFAGGTLDPATGTDVFTWVKSWNVFGYDEPTPFVASYGDGAVLRLMKRGDAVDFSSSWTTSVYTRADMTVRYSVLSPLSVIDLKTKELEAEIGGLKESRKAPAEGWFALASKDCLYVFVTNRTFEKVDCSEKRLAFRLNTPGAVGYVRVAMDQEKELPALAQFYQGLLMHEPIECVQVQKERRIEQVFEYVDRPCDRPVKPVLGAPVPYLVRFSLRPSSQLKVKFDSPTREGPDGWTYVPDSERVAYELPDRPRWHSCGINVMLDSATASTYRELHDLGCQTIRLVCETGSGWKGTPAEEKKKLVCQHLGWIREAGGMKVGLDLHNGWFPDGMNDNKAFEDPALWQEFVERWKTILSWCEPYRDVIGWYDLMNEPQIFFERGPVKPYAEFMRKAVRALRPHAGETPFLVEAVNMANPGGVAMWEDVGEDVIVGYHDYWPHMLTHEWSVEHGDETMPATFYPSFMPGINWSSPSWRDDGLWQYWDCWKCNSVSLPVYRILIEKGVRLDCGEYGVVGYLGQTSPISGAIWMRHAMDRFKRLGINHNAWGVGGGFTWNVPSAKEEMVRFWRENR